MKNIINYIKKPKIFKLFVYLFLIFIFVLSPGVLILSNILFEENFSPDTSFFYHASEFYQTLSIIGQSGRSYYIIIRWTFDLLYPIVYGVFFTQVLFKLKVQKNHFLILPILMVIFDYIENSLATILVVLFPKEFPMMVYILQGFSFLKWLSFLIIFMVIYQSYFHRKNNQ
jgi:hypothetical protein